MPKQAQKAAPHKVSPKVTGDTKEIRYGRGQNPKSRANLVTPEKGEVRNPNGKPAGTKDRATIIKKWLAAQCDHVNPETLQKERMSVEDAMVIGMANAAKKGSAPAFNALMDSVYGKLTDKLDQSGDLTVRVEYVGAGEDANN